MKIFLLPILSIALFFLCSCSFFYWKEPNGVSEVRSPKPLAVPVGKKWQLIEKAPKLTNESEHPSFQGEPSLQPDGATTAPPESNRKVEPR